MIESALEFEPHLIPFALFRDLDDMLTVPGDVPIATSCGMLHGIDRWRFSVHDVTARPHEARKLTKQFLIELRLLGFANMNFCPRCMESDLCISQCTTCTRVRRRRTDGRCR